MSPLIYEPESTTQEVKNKSLYILKQSNDPHGRQRGYNPQQKWSQHPPDPCALRLVETFSLVETLFQSAKTSIKSD